MVQMSVAGLALDASNRTPIVLLRDPSGRRQVPIWIDHAQAHNIMAGLKQSHRDRPSSHDLMMSFLDIGNIHLERVIIHAIQKSTFQAVLKLEVSREDISAKSDDPQSKSIKAVPNETNHSQSSLELEARPSDAIALAIRSKCNIWMLEEVVAKASIPVDPEADEQDQSKFRQFLNDVSPAAMVRYLKLRDSDNENSSGSHDSETNSNE